MPLWSVSLSSSRSAEEKEELLPRFTSLRMSAMVISGSGLPFILCVSVIRLYSPETAREYVSTDGVALPKMSLQPLCLARIFATSAVE